MTRCWKLKPSERPTFRELTNAIEAIQAAGSSHIHVSDSNDCASPDADNLEDTPYEVTLNPPQEEYTNWSVVFQQSQRKQ